jgi:CHAT domain-containing protein
VVYFLGKRTLKTTAIDTVGRMSSDIDAQVKEMQPPEGLCGDSFFAGASNLIDSVWKVDDLATQELMSRFYTHLIEEEMTVARALQQVKIDMLRTRDYQHPFYWAPFNLYGRGL